MYGLVLGLSQISSFFSYVDLRLSIWKDGQLHTFIYDTRDDSNSTSHIFRSCVAIFQLIRYTRDCPSYGKFILRATRLSNKLLDLGYVRERLESSLTKFMVDTGILSNNMKFPSHECSMTCCILIIYNDNPPLIRLYTELDLLPNYERFR